jgi:hypothetical protein
VTILPGSTLLCTSEEYSIGAGDKDAGGHDVEAEYLQTWMFLTKESGLNFWAREKVSLSLLPARSISSSFFRFTRDMGTSLSRELCVSRKAEEDELEHARFLAGITWVSYDCEIKNLEKYKKLIFHIFLNIMTTCK